MTHIHPSWLEIDLDALAFNVQSIKQFVGPRVKVSAVVKANAYGHGAVEIARTALASGATRLCVAYLGEAIELREAGITAPILVMAYTPATALHEAIQRDIAFSVSELAVAQAASRAALALQKPARIHLKIDTGMSRLGVLAAEAPPLIDALVSLPGVQLEGLFTHFSAADDNPDYTALQLRRLNQVLAQQHGARVGARVGTPITIHAANSAATLSYPEAHFDQVRPGVSLYGLTPFSSGWGKLPVPLRPVLTWKAQLALVKTLPAGTPISYGNTYVCESPRRIGVVPVGYGDGFRRAPQHYGEVLIAGQRAPIVGRVCMDQTMVDVTDILTAQTDSEVVIIGQQGAEHITTEAVAARLGTINYEVTTGLAARLPRLYRKSA